MVERIQYLLILLLFAFTGTLGEISFRSDSPEAQTVLTRSSDSESCGVVRNHLSAWTHSCDFFSTETPVVTSDHKVVVRQRAAVRDAVETVFGVRIASRSHVEPPYVHAVDYHVFGLGHILI